ncbi:hypothetical protein Y1Q_0001610 [Alligator mississippiensis]|uniref:Uncharacterized protein n=1 Tax=Alligator mississippiensis TaxID=8496 RepID=A0A151MA46_ALLMI|nr:hypothetical protein Y1Q_0001610 [Alligator mississippiensis]
MKNQEQVLVVPEYNFWKYCFPEGVTSTNLTVLHYRAQTKELLLLSTCAETWHSRTWAVVVFRKPQQQGHKCKH